MNITAAVLWLLGVGLLWPVFAFRWSAFAWAMLPWDIAVLVVWAADALLLPAPSIWRLSREWGEILQLTGDAKATPVRLEVTNQSTAGLWAIIVDSLPAPLRNDAAADLKLFVKAGATEAARYFATPRERGTFAVGFVHLRYRSRLGFAEKWARANLQQQVLVLPDLFQAQQEALRVVGDSVLDARRRERRRVANGRELEALREYRDGDELRSVSWTATARRRQLITRTYTADQSQAVWLLLDAGRLLRARVKNHRSDLTRAKLDYAVDAALALARVATASGDKVALLAYGRAIQFLIGPARGMEQMNRVTRGLAQVAAERIEANHAQAMRTLLKRQTQRCLVIWLTDFAEFASTPDVVEQAAYLSQRHLVVVAAIGQPDLQAIANAVPRDEAQLFRHAAAREMVQRRELIFRKLRTGGTFTVELTPERAAADLINEYVRVKDRGLV